MRILLRWIIAFFMFIPLQTSSADTITVDDGAVAVLFGDGLCSLREAIINANTDSEYSGGDCEPGNGMDTIILVPGSVYTISNIYEASRGLPLITSIITIEGRGARIVREGGWDECLRIFKVGELGQLKLVNITISKGGYHKSTPFGSYEGKNCGGGGIWSDGVLELIDVAILSNSAGQGLGGGIASNGEAHLLRVLVQGNRTESYGRAGGIANGGTMTILDSSIDSNGARLGDAGGIFNSGYLEIRNSGVTNNSITTCEPSFCGSGVGIYNSHEGQIKIYNSTISGNVSGGFGYSDGSGAGISAWGIVEIHHSTITDNHIYNSSESGGGIGGSAIIKNTIIAGNSSWESETADCYSPPSSQGYNIVGDGTGCPSDGTGDQTIAPADVFTKLLGDLQDNGGPTLTHALLNPIVTGFPNPALDAVPVSNCDLATDQRGVKRPLDGTGSGTTLCDVGAYELKPPDAFPITITDGGAEFKTLVFGIEPSATDSLDPDLGEAELPPVPPAGAFDARFILPGGLLASLADYRRNARPIIWRTTFQAGSGGYPITLTWDPASLPPGTFLLKDEITGTLVNVNMRSQSSFSVTNPALGSLVIHYFSIVDVPVTMNAGWKLLSVPVLAEDMSTGALYPGAVSEAFAYDAGYVVQSVLVNGEGYWVKFDDIDSYTLTGETALTMDLGVGAGWNIIGPNDLAVPVAGITSTPEGIITSNLFSYDSGYLAADVLNPGEGYWVKTSQAGTLHLSSSAKRQDDPIEAVEADWIVLLIEDAEGHSQRLYLAPLEVGEAFALPPPPPRGLFDVRFGDDRYATWANRPAEIVLRSAVYPVTIRAMNLGEEELRVLDGLGGSLLEAVLREGEVVTVEIPLERLVIESSSTLPTEFSLSQNYPNPFNPETVIEFAVPKRAHVQLKVYNTLGQRVAELVDGELEAGHHRYQFEAGRYASGVYFYVMRSDSFTDIKYMTLVK